MNILNFQILLLNIWEQKGAFGLPMGVVVFAFWCIMMMKNNAKAENEKNLSLLDQQKTELRRITNAEEQKARKESQQKQIEAERIKQETLIKKSQETKLRDLRKKIAEKDAELDVFLNN